MQTITALRQQAAKNGHQMTRIVRTEYAGERYERCYCRRCRARVGTINTVRIQTSAIQYLCSDRLPSQELLQNVAAPQAA